MLFYAAGVLAEIPPAQRKQVKNIKLTIVQPHAQGREPINSWSIGVLDLLMWVDGVLVPGVMACTQDDVAVWSPGPGAGSARCHTLVPR